jgi:general secretion pathway protein E
LPQDGRATVKIGDNEVDIRISSVPTAYGERIVMRLLDKSARTFDLKELGMAPKTLETFSEYLSQSHGIILVTGPTGSGKTTTLYAALQSLNATELNILTLEDPIEYQLHGISQVEINDKKGLNFSSGLRSFVRQDPDVIMVGEIRDLPTAQIAIESALTGHLVFSTVHTNDAPSTVTRLVDLDVEPFLVSSSVLVVVAQRLLRMICPHCREGHVVTDVEAKAVDLKAADFPDGMTYSGRGCHQCYNTGYLGRMGIYEVMPVSNAIRELIMRKGSAAEIKSHAMRHEGLTTLRMDALSKLLEHKTTIEEVLRITHRDQM